ncbi:MAG: hypothetical protein HYX41_07920 [Bdellovibrio sp.]|nr:hypothetical protein [Bdellovibrio sp.]
MAASPVPSPEYFDPYPTIPLSLKSSIALLSFILNPSVIVATEEKLQNHEVRTYMPFSYPVDPAKTHTIPDMNIANALSSTLVEWDEEKELSSGLAESWKIVAPNTYRVHLRAGAHWSNGKPILPSEIKQSIERTLKIHLIDTKEIARSLKAIECPTLSDIDFKLYGPAHSSGFLKHLAEPRFGILKLKENGQLDLSVTSGPFLLLPKSSEKELSLARNPRWTGQSTGFSNADQIIIRPLPKNADSQNILLADAWPNFIETLSVSSPSLTQQYEKAGFVTWKPPLDKLFYIQLGRKGTTSEGQALLSLLRTKLNRKALLQDLTGYSLTDQVFPRGYPLHDPAFACTKQTNSLPETFQERPIEVLISPARVPRILQENLRLILKDITGINPHFISVPLDEVYRYRLLGNFDLYAGSIGIGEPDPDALLSFYLEGDMPILYPDEHLKQHLRLSKATLHHQKKASHLRSILREATCAGHILPLFHLSTMGVGTRNLDFSHISDADESIRLSKILFKTETTILARKSK